MVLVSPGEQKNHFEVIDGQQRLTTFYLLLCALRNRFKGTPQSQSISGLISTDYTTRDGDIKTTLKLEPKYENADEIMAAACQARYGTGQGAVGDPAGWNRHVRFAGKSAERIRHNSSLLARQLR